MHILDQHIGCCQKEFRGTDLQSSGIVPNADYRVMRSPGRQLLNDMYQAKFAEV